MALRYDSPQTGALRQGEILHNVWEHIVRFPPVETQQGQSFEVFSIAHEYVVVMSPDCDLNWDFVKRFPDQHAKEQLISPANISEDPSAIQHVLLAEAYQQGRVRSRIKGSDIWRRIQSNQDERYHHLPSAQVGNPELSTVPELIIDFKKALAIPIQSLYEGLRVSGVKRVATLPSPYIYDLMHRYYGFLSRIALPD